MTSAVIQISRRVEQSWKIQKTKDKHPQNLEPGGKKNTMNGEREKGGTVRKYNAEEEKQVLGGTVDDSHLVTTPTGAKKGITCHQKNSLHEEERNKNRFAPNKN